MHIHGLPCFVNIAADYSELACQLDGGACTHNKWVCLQVRTACSTTTHIHDVSGYKVVGEQGKKSRSIG